MDYIAFSGSLRDRAVVSILVLASILVLV